MKPKFWLLIPFLFLIALIVTACSSTPLLRYGNRAFCLGYFAVSGTRTEGIDTGYGFPVQAARMEIRWHEASDSFVLNDINTLLHVINLAGVVESEQDNSIPFRDGTGFVLAENRDLAAFTIWADDGPRVYVYPFGDEIPVEPEPLAIMRNMRSPVWHPSELLLAGIYYPEDYELGGSNLIAVFDITRSSSDPMDIYELEYIDINGVLGWSNSGQVIAALQYDKSGLIPYYLFLETGTVERSLYHTPSNNCVTDAQWSPREQTIAFSGENAMTEGWDIFLETIASPDSDNGSLINVTNTPQEDERDISWSPDGLQIAYMKGYEDTVGNLRQELFVINLNDASYSPVQLTDTLNEFETNPMWISDNEIAYLSWSPTELIWSLNTISVTAQEQKRIMEIPQSWYRQPGLEDQ